MNLGWSPKESSCVLQTSTPTELIVFCLNSINLANLAHTHTHTGGSVGASPIPPLAGSVVSALHLIYGHGTSCRADGC